MSGMKRTKVDTRLFNMAVVDAFESLLQAKRDLRNAQDTYQRIRDDFVEANEKHGPLDVRALLRSITLGVSADSPRHGPPHQRYYLAASDPARGERKLLMYCKELSQEQDRFWTRYDMRPILPEVFEDEAGQVQRSDSFVDLFEVCDSYASDTNEYSAVEWMMEWRTQSKAKTHLMVQKFQCWQPFFVFEKRTPYQQNEARMMDVTYWGTTEMLSQAWALKVGEMMFVNKRAPIDIEDAKRAYAGACLAGVTLAELKRRANL